MFVRGIIEPIHGPSLPYPITETLGVGFLQYLVDTGKYCYNTLSTVTYQSLIRLNVSRTGTDIKLTVRESMRRKLREITTTW